jgi:pimeloyl-ACP methyl ester carboxylesterase
MRTLDAPIAQRMPGPTAQTAQRASRKQRLLTGLKRGLLGLLVALVALAVGGMSYQALATRRGMRAYPPPGQLIDVGGYRLHLHCTGQGSPTVVLESGLAGISPLWARVQAGVAATTRVCAYDRAGLGWSDPGPAPRDARQIARELHALLGIAGVAGPYVLVGHSLGGEYALAYADAYPADVAGLVLVEASHPDGFAGTPEERARFDGMTRQAALLPPLSRLGILRLLGFPAADPGLPVEQRPVVRALGSTTRFVETYRAELRAIPASADQVRAMGDLGTLPLIVLTATDHGSGADAPQGEARWQALQAELAARSSASVHRVVDGATHMSLVTDPEDAVVTVAAIAQVVEAARTGRPLAR